MRSILLGLAALGIAACGPTEQTAASTAAPAAETSASPAAPSGPSPGSDPALAAAAAPAVQGQPPNDTLLAIVERGIVLTMVDGTAFQMSLKPDRTYTFKTPETLVSGTWRTDGDKLCTISTTNPKETCTVYPAGKKSGDKFELESATLGHVTAKIG